MKIAMGMVFNAATAGVALASALVATAADPLSSWNETAISR